MAYPLGLKLYLLAHRGEAAPDAPPHRPEGRLVWLHAPDADAARPLAELARRIMDEAGHPVLVTGPAGIALPDGAILAPPPAEGSVKPFLDHWKPALAVFSDGELRPALLGEASARNIPMMLVDARAPVLPHSRDAWWPGLTRALLSRFAHILTLDEASARAFRRWGAPPDTVKIAGRMEEGTRPLPCTEAERAELARLIATRPVWLAAGLTAAEEEIVIAAHRSALRLSHRLLLIVVPEDPERATGLAEHLEAEGFTVARRALEEEPDAEAEVYVADNPAEYGLWYRLAPICFLGGTFSSGAVRDPMEAASLGSAILHGPKPGPYGGALSRLAAAKATLPVAQARVLGDAVGDLMSPDRVAWLAQAAWGVASDGTEVTDRVLALVERILDE
ncbi:glycosyltransferase N-terminal domain-containing protein [Cereibacter sp. SYSU M97828]|nr:glycosyltransferase N-terminal domain-containing protein [Cereibacter flavus]